MLTEAKNREGSQTRDLARIQAEIEAFRQSQAKRDSEHLLNLSTLEKKAWRRNTLRLSRIPD